MSNLDLILGIGAPVALVVVFGLIALAKARASSASTGLVHTPRGAHAGHGTAAHGHGPTHPASGTAWKWVGGAAAALVAVVVVIWLVWSLLFTPGKPDPSFASSTPSAPRSWQPPPVPAKHFTIHAPPAGGACSEVVEVPEWTKLCGNEDEYAQVNAKYRPRGEVSLDPDQWPDISPQAEGNAICFRSKTAETVTLELDRIPSSRTCDSVE